MTDSPTLYPVILSGGSGTRLWPMSRAAEPKQLLPLLSEHSLLQETVRRLDGQKHGAPLILANENHRFVIAEQLRLIEVRPLAILLEPVARSTAPAIAAAALWLARREPDALMLVMPSDHTVADRPAFARAVEIGARVAASGRLVTFGIEATGPETGYGYIRRGDALGIDGSFAVEAFVEKPDRATAETYLASGTYTWNSGIFLFPVSLYLAELERLRPATLAAIRDAVEGAQDDLDFVRLAESGFAKAENISVDYAVMEHTSHAAVVPVAMGWSDVGAWDALWELAPGRDEAGNVAIGDVIQTGCRNTYLRSDGRLLAACGVEDLIVVATPDAILVAPRGRSQEVARVVDVLKRDKRHELTQPAVTHRPWGSYRTVHQEPDVDIRHILVEPGGKLSLQVHRRRTEHWVVVHGVARVSLDERELTVHENESIVIPVGSRHRLENPADRPLHLIEVRSGSYLGEDDVVRLDNRYRP